MPKAALIIVTPAPVATRKPRIRLRKRSARDGVLAHDEVRERPPRRIAVDKPQRHPGPRIALDPNDLCDQQDRFFAGQIEMDLDGRPRPDDLGRAHEQPATADIFDKTVDNESMRATLRADSDRDSNSCPLVHVVKATLATHV